MPISGPDLTPLDTDLIPPHLAVSHRVLPMKDHQGDIVFLTDVEISLQRQKTLTFLARRPAKLESLNKHPALRDFFAQTLERLKKNLAGRPTRISRSSDQIQKELS